MRDAALRGLARIGLLVSAYRAYEAVRSARAPRRRSVVEGLPLPPARLMLKVAGTTDADWFVTSGRRAAESIAAALERRGRDVRRLESVLDLGCGCGRVIRHWRDLPARVHGTDANGELIAWCSENLPFARFARNDLAPPLPYDDDSFDLVYALSVLTHLPEPLQLAWLAELRRVLRPGGWLLLTTHGDAYVGRLRPDERRRFEDGDVVVRWPEAAGSNLCTVFHPESYIRRVLTAGFELEEFVARGAAGNPFQDQTLLRAR